MRRLVALSWLSCLLVLFASVPIKSIGQAANGKLQIHFMDVGQGDGAILISPLGETVLFDNGVRNLCDRPVSYLQQLGISSVDYHVASHYHDDHIGCTKEVLDEFPLAKLAFDRGATYHTVTYNRYVSKIGSKRRTATVGQRVTLDEATAHPVHVEFIAVNGAGVETENENDLSLVAVVRFGHLDVEIGGDLSGFRTDNYEDIETPVAPLVGQIEVYKVHHHGSRYSSNRHWLETIRPKIGIISAGKDNKHGHPTADTIERLHQENVKLYWTSEGGAAEPEAEFDVIGGNIIVEMAAGGKTFTVRHTRGSQVAELTVWDNGGSPTPTPTPTTYSWSKKSNVYHYTSCRYVANISPENLATGNAPPSGKTLHRDCPK